MQFERLLDDLRYDEGFRAEPYLDTMNRWTIGYGNTYIGGERVTSDTPPVSKDTALDMLMGDAYSACIDAQWVIRGFNDLDDIRQEVLVNMAFNLGGRGLSRFVKMIACIEQGDYLGAAHQLKDSRYYRQVGQRAKRLHARMKTGIHEA